MKLENSKESRKETPNHLLPILFPQPAKLSACPSVAGAYVALYYGILETFVLRTLSKSEEGFLSYDASIFNSVLVYTAERDNS